MKDNTEVMATGITLKDAIAGHLEFARTFESANGHVSIVGFLPVCYAGLGDSTYGKFQL